MHVFNNLFRHRYLIQDVFTPTSAAKLTYIDRKQLDDDLRRALNIPGMQVILYGYSGGGKTTLIENELAKNNRRYISTICNSDTSVDQLVLVALDKLELYYTSQKTHTGSTSASFGLSAKYFSLRGLINEKAEVVEKRAIPIQLTPQRLAEFLGDIECIWVVEDFHKVPEVEKRKFAQMLKTFVDISNKYKKTKTICIGAVGTAREVVTNQSISSLT